MELTTLKDLFVEELKDIYSAETQITEALPKMAEAATNPQLKAAFELHLKQTQEQVKRLEAAFEKLEESPTGKHCKGMEGLLEEGEELMEEDGDPDVIDAGLIAAAQKVEHYEIASYGTVIAYAELLKNTGVLTPLREILEEEKSTDKKLSALAESTINVQAQ